MMIATLPASATRDSRTASASRPEPAHVIVGVVELWTNISSMTPPNET
jgi:hypothetical protein